MANKIAFCSLDEFTVIKDKYLDNQHSYVVEIYGDKISNIDDYLIHMEKALKFPRPCEGIFDRYEDWIRDLSWFDYDEYVFIIYNYKSFFRNDLKWRNVIIDSFKNVVLPYWEKDVINCCVDGKPKKMNVYILNK